MKQIVKVATLIVLSGAHELDLCAFCFQVDEDKLRTLATNALDSSRHSYDFIEECAHWNVLSLINLAEMIDSVCAREFMRVRVTSLVANVLYVVPPIFSILGRVQFFLDLLLLVAFLLCFLLLLFILSLLLGLIFSELLPLLQLAAIMLIRRVLKSSL